MSPSSIHFGILMGPISSGIFQAVTAALSIQGQCRGHIQKTVLHRTLVFETSASLNLELIDLARPAGQWPLRIH